METEKKYSEADLVGALYDFGGFLTTRPNSIAIGSGENAAPVAELVKEFTDKRGLDDTNANVNSWKSND